MERSLISFTKSGKAPLKYLITHIKDKNEYNLSFHSVGRDYFLFTGKVIQKKLPQITTAFTLFSS